MSQSDKGVDVEGIGKSFGSVVALRDISFDVGRGEVVALLGPNGAGKTTTVEILSTLTTPDRGRARVAGLRRGRRPCDGAQVDHADRPARGSRRHADRIREPGDVRQAAGFEEVRGQDARPRPAARVRSGTGRRPAGRHLFRRHAPTRRHRLRAGGAPRGRVPRRADHRAWIPAAAKPSGIWSPPSRTPVSRRC